MIAVQDTDVRKERVTPRAKITINLGHGKTTRVSYGKALGLLVAPYKTCAPTGTTTVRFMMAPDAESLAKTIAVHAKRDIRNGHIVDVGDYEIHQEREYNYRKESDGYDVANAPTYDMVRYYCPRTPDGKYAADEDSDRVVVKKGAYNRKYDGEDWIDVFLDCNPALKRKVMRTESKEDGPA